MAVVVSQVTPVLGQTTSRAVVAVPTTSSRTSTSLTTSSRTSTSITSTSISSTTSSSVRSTTSSSVASSTSISSTSLSVRSTTSSASSSLSSSSSSSSSSATSSSASASASAVPASSGISSLAKSLIIAGICVASAIALIVAVGFLLRRRRDTRRDRRNRTHELDGYGKDARGSPQFEKDQPGVGDERFVQALGRGERPSGRAGEGLGGIYGASAGAGAMYAGSEASLQQPPMAVNDGVWGGAGGYGQQDYPPQPYSAGGFAPPHSASQQYLVPRTASPVFSNHHQQSYTPPYSTPQDEFFRSPSPYNQQPSPPPPPQQQQSYYSSQEHQPQDPYQDPTPQEAQAMAGVGGNPSLGGALVPGGALDEEGVEMRVVRGFQATLDDELEIVIYGLLKVHQSYEDGWSLCSNPQTKQRGVVPRDCLALPSTLPESFHPPASDPSHARNLPQIPSQSFSSSQLYDPSANRQSQYNASSSRQEEVDENNHPLAPPPTFGVAMGYEDSKGRPLSVVVQDQDGTEREVMRSELGAAGPSSAEFGGLDVPGIPRSGSHNSLTPSERQERRSSLMDSVRAAGQYLEHGGASGTHL